MMAFSRNRSNDLLIKQVSTVATSSNSYTTCGKNNMFNFNIACQAHKLRTFYFLSLKLHNTIASIWFNRQCLTNRIIPKYANIIIKQKTLAAKRTQSFCQTLRIKNELHYLQSKKEAINKKLLHTHLEITNTIQTENFLAFYENMKQDIDKQMNTKYNTLRKKLDKLIIKNHPPTKKDNFHQRTVNLTDTAFSPTELTLLDKGLKHNLTSNNRRKDMEQLIVDTELAINKLPTDKQTHARHSAVDILHKIQTNTDKNNHNNTDNKTLRHIQKKLDNNNLTITKADKGNTTVIIKNTDYTQMTEDFINKNGYTKLNKDPTDKYQTEIRNTIKMSPLVITPKNTFKYINPNPSAPTLKALPKIHKKPNITIRPIINYRTAPAYKTSQDLAIMTKDLVQLDDKHTLKNSHELTTLTHNLTLTPNSKLISLDVTNLYTSIPVHETLIILEEKLLLNHNPQLVTQLINLLRTTLKQNYFTFNDNIFVATDGLGMGHPTSAVMTEVFMQSLEDVFVPRITERFGVAYYKRYVDDIFIVIDSEVDNTDNLLTYMNTLHNNINFTIEKETDGQLNYMDLTITRKQHKLEYSIYRKPTSTDHTIHSTSNHPTQHKLAAYRSMIHRLHTIPLTPENYTKELNTIYNIADRNGYTKQDIDKLITQHKQKKGTANTTKDGQTNDSQWTALTYVGKETYRLTNFFNKHNLKTGFKTNNNLGNKLKRKTSHTNTFNNSGVYRLTCKDCQQDYIGRTYRKLNTRYKEHIRSYIYDRTDSNFANHLRTHGHEPDSITNTMTLLHKQTKGPKLAILEQLEIYKHRITNGTIINEQLTSNSDITFSVLKPDLDRKRKRDNDSSDNHNNKKHKHS